MKNYVQPGEYIEVTLAAAAVSGQGMLVGSMFGIAAKSGAIGELVNLALEGVFEHAKEAEALAVGDLVYWNDTNKTLTTTVGTNKLIGVAVKANLIGDATGTVRLNSAFIA